MLTIEKQSDVISSYEKQIEKMGQEEIDNCLQDAKEYDKSDYQNLLNPIGNGMMGSIEIPKIKAHLPVYHGTEEALEIGIGHIEGSSLPVGGASTHCLLAGHRGSPNAELFGRLGEMEKGDILHLYVYRKKLTYVVCEVRVIHPENTDGLGVLEGRDLVSLITCTPYGINTHRLIVTAERMEE